MSRGTLERVKTRYRQPGFEPAREVPFGDCHKLIKSVPAAMHCSSNLFILKNRIFRVLLWACGNVERERRNEKRREISGRGKITTQTGFEPARENPISLLPSKSCFKTDSLTARTLCPLCRGVVIGLHNPFVGHRSTRVPSHRPSAAVWRLVCS